MNIIDRIKPTTPATLKEAVMRGLVKTIKLVGFVAIGFLMVHWLTGGQDEIVNGMSPDRDAQVMNIREPAKGTPSYVMSKHQDECWTSKQTPKAELPGAAVVQYPSGLTKYVTNETPRGFATVDAAFNEALAAVGYGDKTTDEFEVIALCK